jgi:plastocyanin
MRVMIIYNLGGNEMRKLAFAGIIIGLGFAAYAGAVTEVQIRDFEFVPATVVVMKGDSVKWTNVGQVLHTSTSDTGKWDSGDLSHGQSFEFKFTETGTFGYHCSYHAFMTGAVRVTEEAVEPTSFGRVRALYR